MISSEDRNEILDLVTRYSFAWDSSDADGFTAIFTDTAVMQFFVNGAQAPTTTLSGENAFRKAIAGRINRFDRIGLVTKHYMPNSIISPLDLNSAHVKTQAQITWQLLPDYPQPRPVQAGYYLSEVVRTEQGWQFSKRDVYLNGSVSIKEIYGGNA